MIATSQFVFLHLPKTGGTFLNEALMRFVPGARQLGYHLPRSMIPQSLRALPVLGFVRNPWSYYVSWYSFQYALPQRNALFETMSRNGALDFKGTVRNLLNLGADSNLLDELLPRMPAAYSNRGLNLPGFALEGIRNSFRGFYSFLFHYLFAPDAGSLHLGRLENLRADFPRLLEQLAAPVSEDLREYLERETPRNTSPHGFYTGYYDDELRDLVAIRDREVINAMAYRFGD